MSPTLLSPRPASGPLPPPSRGLTPRRRGVGLVVVAAALPALTAVLVALHDHVTLATVLLLYQVCVVAASLVGGMIPGVLAAVLSFMLANFFLTPPYHTLLIENRDNIVALLVFLHVAVAISVLVDVAARREAQAARSRAEASLLGRVAAGPLAARSAEDILGEIAETFGLNSVYLLEQADGRTSIIARTGASATGKSAVSVPAGPDRMLVGEGPELFAEDRGLLARLAQAAGRAVDEHKLAGAADRARELAEVDRLRSALLAALGHDLRTPLTGITAAATTLAARDSGLTEADRADLAATIVESADRLADIIANLLDLSRMEAGALTIDFRPVSLDEIVARALIDRRLSGVHNQVPDDLPMVRADPGLLERVVANLVDNARRHSPSTESVEIRGRAIDGQVILEVVDHGTGVAESEWGRMFLPFQRLDDRSADGGVGLGLAIAKGFTDAMGGTLRPQPTAGGGMTMTLTLPRAGSDGG